MSDFKLRAERPSGAVGGREVGAPAFGGWRARWAMARWWKGRSALSYFTTAIFVLVGGLFLGLTLVAFALIVSAFGGGIVEGSVRLALSHGTLAAGLALVIGAGATYLWCRLAECRLRGRELEA